MNSAQPAPAASPPQVGTLLREWRERRRRTQLDLALDAGVSTRHLSFVETGRARPSRDMVLHLARELEVPLRVRNTLLLAAGFAPAYAERTLDDPALNGARRAIDAILAAHEPNPALVVDRAWRMVAANGAVAPLLDGVSPELLSGPVNVLRLTLHPDGLASRLANFHQWRAHVLGRLRSQHEATQDEALPGLIAELETYPAPTAQEVEPSVDLGGIAVPFQLRTPEGVLSFISATTLFGAPRDVTLSELALESFLPADEATAAAMRRLAGRS